MFGGLEPVWRSSRGDSRWQSGLLPLSAFSNTRSQPPATLMIYGLHVPLTTQTEYIECKVGFPVCLDTKCSRTMLKGSLRVPRSDKQTSWDLPGAGTVAEWFGETAAGHVCAPLRFSGRRSFTHSFCLLWHVRGRTMRLRAGFAEGLRGFYIV